MKNISYRMWGATMRLVVLVFLTATALLLLGKIEAATWANVTMNGVLVWLTRDGLTKGFEMYRDIKTPQAPQAPQ